MWWFVGLLVVLVVLGVLLERRRRGSSSGGTYDGEAPFGPESAASYHRQHGDTGWGAGGS